MKTSTLCAALLLALALPATLAAQQLAPERARITDETIAGDLATMNAVQKRLTELNNKGVPIGSYHFAKAQAWLDFARDEYNVNDRSPATQEALRESAGIVGKLEREEKGVGMFTPIISSSKTVRVDLWEIAERYKKDPHFGCAEDRVAQLEVQLVWAGHEEVEMGWRHSKPFLLAAERLAREAGKLMADCRELDRAKAALPACNDALSAPRVESAPLVGMEHAAATAGGIVVAGEGQTVPGEGSGAETAVSGEIVVPLPDRIHFALNRADISVIGSALLDRVAGAMRGNRKLRVELRGHADERASSEYNLALAERRCENVKRYLAAAGIGADRIAVTALGKSRPLESGPDPRAHAGNRRVELVFSGEDGVSTEPQYGDLQVERKGGK